MSTGRVATTRSGAASDLNTYPKALALSAAAAEPELITLCPDLSPAVRILSNDIVDRRRREARPEGEAVFLETGVTPGSARDGRSREPALFHQVRILRGELRAAGQSGLGFGLPEVAVRASGMDPIGTLPAAQTAG